MLLRTLFFPQNMCSLKCSQFNPMELLTAENACLVLTICFNKLSFSTENTYLFFWEHVNHKQEWMGNVKVERIFHVCSCLDFTFLGFYLAAGMKIKTSSVASQDRWKKEFSFQNQKWDMRELGLLGVGGECPVPVLPSQPVTLTRLYLFSLQFILILKWGTLHLNHL